LTARENESVFAEIVDRAKVLDPVNARKWFDELVVLDFDGGSLRIGYSSEPAVNFLRSTCRAAFTRAAQQVTGHLVTVDFELSRPAEGHRPEGGLPRAELHPDYTFDNFVVGPSNRLAHASCVAVSQSPGSTYNPLFIYGNSGLGKTHLLHAVCYENITKTPGGVTQFLSCEDFINRFIRAIQEGDLVGFKGRLRAADMLVIDDVQFLREREQTQEEFFHTFNALYNAGKQIILSADSPPGSLPSLEDRLISRFNWGLVARIDPPSYETRIAIVQKKAQLRGIDISDEIAQYIAHKVQANIRELEGALTTIYAMSVAGGGEISIDLARTAVEGQIKLPFKNISITDIIEVVTGHFDVRLADLQSKKRSQSITMPRQVCMYLARSLTRHSLEEIGGHLGGRDHTTVLHACNKIDQAAKADPRVNGLLAELTKRISAEVAG
jgi:chromosomal replication initiator protein